MPVSSLLDSAPRTFCRKFWASGVGGSLAGRAEMLARFHRFLMDVRRRGLTAALIDEAHQLSGEVLEEMGLLLTDEAASILQIVLVGQPPLDLLLDSPALRGLKEKVGLHAGWTSGADEGQQYIDRHLQLAGARIGPPGFSPRKRSRTSSTTRGRSAPDQCDLRQGTGLRIRAARSGHSPGVDRHRRG